MVATKSISGSNISAILTNGKRKFLLCDFQLHFNKYEVPLNRHIKYTLQFIIIEGPVDGFVATVCGVLCLSHVTMKDSALGKQVFFLRLDMELLMFVNPKALENQASTEDEFLFCDTTLLDSKPSVFAALEALSHQNFCIC